MSLKSKLIESIQEGYKTLSELHYVGATYMEDGEPKPKKQSNVERTLRSIVIDEDGIEADKNLKGHITGYSYNGDKSNDIDIRLARAIKRHASFGDPIYMELMKAKSKPDWVKENLLKRYE